MQSMQGRRLCVAGTGGTMVCTCTAARQMCDVTSPRCHVHPPLSPGPAHSDSTGGPAAHAQRTPRLVSHPLLMAKMPNFSLDTHFNESIMCPIH